MVMVKIMQKKVISRWVKQSMAWVRPGSHNEMVMKLEIYQIIMLVMADMWGGYWDHISFSFKIHLQSELLISATETVRLLHTHHDNTITNLCSCSWNHLSLLTAGDPVPIKNQRDNCPCYWNTISTNRLQQSVHKLWRWMILAVSLLLTNSSSITYG